MADYPLLNGHKFSWADAEIDLNGTIFVGIKELTVTQSQEKGMVRGTSPQVLARTRGEYEAEASVVMYTEDYFEFITGLGDGYGEVSFDITFSWSGPNLTTRTLKCLSCEIKSEEIGGSQGTDAAEVSFDIDIIQCELDGKRMTANALI